MNNVTGFQNIKHFLTKMTDPKDSTFKSYIDDQVYESISLKGMQQTKLLDGEMAACTTPQVLMFAPLSDRKKATLGTLIVTTYRLSFAIAEDETVDPESYCCQQNALLGPNDVCLSSIDFIYQIKDRTRKRLPPGQNVSGKIKDLLIVCKNMRQLEFSFKHADKDGGKNIANALVHHCYPKRHNLLFAYEYREPYMPNKASLRDVCFFRTKDDWSRELIRTKCPNWRVSDSNEFYRTCQSLMSTLIVPQSVTDSILHGAIEHFRSRRCPVWVWGTEQGAALVRMAELLTTVPDRTQENILLEHIRKSHPDKKRPQIFDLGEKYCPTARDIQTSFLRLRELCAPENSRVFKLQDFKFYGLLDATKWLLYVSQCLTSAVGCAKWLAEKNTTVVLQEGDGNDLNCIVSCLVQLMLDPYFRTKSGFQSLIQKDWISLGHSFAYRLGHSLDKECEQSPVFLLFLDCVWQLLQQFPTAFQINETYLTTLWDSVHNSIFDTFLFNCQHDRYIAEMGQMNKPLILRSVWDWHEQFTDRDIALFFNPLYDESFHAPLVSVGSGVPHLEIWMQCYFRWLPDLEIQNGGRPQVDLCHRIIVSRIVKLQQEILQNKQQQQQNNNTENSCGKFNPENCLNVFSGNLLFGDMSGGDEEKCDLELLRKVNSFFPFSRSNGHVTLPSNNVLLTGDLLDSQSILNLNND